MTDHDKNPNTGLTAHHRGSKGTTGEVVLLSLQGGNTVMMYGNYSGPRREHDYWE